eukprot:10174880-Alexandrium_andersonii.AAC.1
MIREVGEFRGDQCPSPSMSAGDCRQIDGGRRRPSPPSGSHLEGGDIPMPKKAKEGSCHLLFLSVAR